MTEQQIRDGYARLDTALTPPLDAHDRVARRVRQRRQRRRAGLAGAVTLAVVGAGAGAVVLSGGDAPTDDLIASEPPSGSTLTITRPDGSTYTFPDVTVTCEPPETPGGDEISDVPGRIWLFSPMLFEGPANGNGGDMQLQQPFVYFEGVVSKLQGDRTLALPVDGPGDSSSYPLTLFVADTEGSPDGNEVASSAGGATGTVRVLRAECGPTPVLELDVDATLGSEEGLDPLALAGTVR